MKALYLLAGCNGAGKTTAAFALLPGLLDCHEFVNADEIARGLSPFRPEAVSVQAGRLLLGRVQELLAADESFALETTLATRIYLKIIANAQAQGYFVSLLFFWLPSPDVAVARVAMRVREGGHFIPEDVIRRRYVGGLRQFFGAYAQVVDKWSFFDNSAGQARLLATNVEGEETVVNGPVWQQLKATYHV